MERFPPAERPPGGLPTRLDGRTLLAARTLWLGSTAVIVTISIVGFARMLRSPELVTPPVLVELVTSLDVSLRAIVVATFVTPFVVVVAVCAVVFWRRSRDPMALLFTLTLLVFYAFSSRPLLTFSGTLALPHPSAVALGLMLIGLSLMLAWFPDGRPVPRGSRWLVPAMAIVVVIFPDAAGLVEAFAEGRASGRTITFAAALSSVLLCGVIAQVHRYRHVSGPTERQQAKWVIAPFAMLYLVCLVFGVANVLLADRSGPSPAWLLLLLVGPATALFPVAVANAVLRHRLYDIDRFISRTISYVITTLTLIVLYTTSVLVLGAVLRGLSGRNSALTVAASTLIAAAAFRPALVRVERAVEARFNRRRHDGKQAVERFSSELRSQVELDDIVGTLIGTTERLLVPAHTTLWLLCGGHEVEAPSVGPPGRVPSTDTIADPAPATPPTART